MGACARVELLKARRRPAVWALGVLWMVLGLVFGYLIPYLLYRNDNDMGLDPRTLLDSVLPAAFVENSIQGAPLFGFAIALILGVLLTAGEYGWGTLTTVLVQGPSRTRVLAGKAQAVAVVLGVLALANMAIAALASLVVAGLEGEPVVWPAVGDVAGGLASGWLIMLTAAALGGTLAVVLRSTSLAVGLGLVEAFVVEGLVRGFATLSSFVRTVAEGLPGVNAGSLAFGFVLNPLRANTPGMNDLVSPGVAALVLAAYLLGALVVARTVFARRDVAG